MMTPLNPYDPAEEVQAFVQKYKDKVGDQEAIPNQFAADGYDCIYAIAAACEKAGITADMKADEVCEKMIATFTDAGFSVDGLTGSGMTWSTAGEISKDPVVVKIVDGAYVNM